MHEMSLAKNIIDIIDETLVNEEYNSLKEVVIEIGELIAVVPSSLQFCYTALTEQTPYEDSKLTINIIPVQGRCKNCNLKFEIIDMCFICPACQSGDLEIEQGRELNISYLEVD